MMKSRFIVIAVALAAMSLAGGVDAFTFSPAPSKFTAKGPGSATMNGTTIDGTVTFKGAVAKSGKAKITAVKFCGVGGCGFIGAGGLPWAMKATSATTATLDNVTITSNAGDFGPGNLKISVSGGTIIYNGPLGQCSQVTFQLTTTPKISIIH
jgi:hypothetical protein